MTKTKDVAESTAAKFTKETLLSARRFAGCRDALSAALADGKSYTIAEAELVLEKFLKGKVD